MGINTRAPDDRVPEVTAAVSAALTALGVSLESGTNVASGGAFATAFPLPGSVVSTASKQAFASAVAEYVNKFAAIVAHVHSRVKPGGGFLLALSARQGYTLVSDTCVYELRAHFLGCTQVQMEEALASAPRQ